MLYLDPGTKLFVSRQALGKVAPLSVQRMHDNRIVMAKLIEKYGRHDFCGSNAYPHLQHDADFAPFGDPFQVILDFIFAYNGLPSPVLNESGEINVAATVQDHRDRQRLPARLLKKNMAPKITPPYCTREEILAALKRRGLPIPAELLKRS